jgi:hypothetical protein
MFNRKTEKKEPKTQEVDKSLSFYDSMIDDIFADSSENAEKAPNTDGDTAPLEEDVTYTEVEEICDAAHVAGAEAVSDSPSEENAIAEEGTAGNLTDEGTAVNIHHSITVQVTVARTCSRTVD